MSGLTTETFGRVLVVHTPDEFTEEVAARFVDAVTAATNQDHTGIVLQMDHTETYDSAGLGSLLDLQDHVREWGGTVKICALGDPGKKILEMTRLDRRFDVFDSVIDAVGSFRS